MFLGIGALKPKPLDMPGAELQGVYQGLPFLIQKNLAEALGQPLIEVTGKRVVVLGGGDTAMDCLRTAVRCGARETICAYRRDLANMPGSRREYANAVEEGARFCSSPTRSRSSTMARSRGRSAVVRMELGEPDATGRRKPRPMKGSEFTVPVDFILIAYGFDPVPILAAGDSDRIAVNEWGGETWMPTK